MRRRQRRRHHERSIGGLGLGRAGSGSLNGSSYGGAIGSNGIVTRGLNGSSAGLGLGRSIVGASSGSVALNGNGSRVALKPEDAAVTVSPVSTLRGSPVWWRNSWRRRRQQELDQQQGLQPEQDQHGGLQPQQEQSQSQYSYVTEGSTGGLVVHTVPQEDGPAELPGGVAEAHELHAVDSPRRDTFPASTMATAGPAPAVGVGNDSSSVIGSQRIGAGTGYVGVGIPRTASVANHGSSGSGIMVGGTTFRPSQFAFSSSSSTRNGIVDGGTGDGVIPRASSFPLTPDSTTSSVRSPTFLRSPGTGSGGIYNGRSPTWSRPPIFPTPGPLEPAVLRAGDSAASAVDFDHPVSDGRSLYEMPTWETHDEIGTAH